MGGGEYERSAMDFVAWFSLVWRVMKLGNRYSLRTAGPWYLVVASLGAAWIWFAYMLPMKRHCNPLWVLSHSRTEVWGNAQVALKRGVWTHDDGFLIGENGDAHWAEWIMGRVSPGERMDCMSRWTHADTAMELMTNQAPGEGSDAWLAWWEREGGKSQVDWMVEGFAQAGVEVAVPPSREDWPALLRVMSEMEGAGEEENGGEGEDKDWSPTGVPDRLVYNAFRWLRDSGFDPVRFALDHREELTPTLERGLSRYQDYSLRFPKSDGIGILAFGMEEDSTGWWRPLPQFLGWKFRSFVYAVIFLPGLIGVGMLVVRWRWPGAREGGDGLRG